jgi:hypothetical protein
MTTLTLDVRRHCVETEIRRLLNRALSAVFKSGSDRQAHEGEIELLQQALRSLDFHHLRSTCPCLAGQCDARVELAGTGKTLLRLTIDGATVDPVGPGGSPPSPTRS